MHSCRSYALIWNHPVTFTWNKEEEEEEEEEEEIIHLILPQAIYNCSGLSTSHGKELVHPLEDWLV